MHKLNTVLSPDAGEGSYYIRTVCYMCLPFRSALLKKMHWKKIYLFISMLSKSMAQTNELFNV